MTQNIASCVVLRLRIRLKVLRMWVSSWKPDNDFEFQYHCIWDTTLHLLYRGSDVSKYLSSYQTPTHSLVEVDPP